MITHLTKYNNLMHEAVLKLQSRKKNKLEGNLLDLMKVLTSKIVEKEECILLSNVANLNPKASYKQYQNRTECESSQNHVHMSDFTNRKDRTINLLELGLYFSKILMIRLKESFPNYSFLISISYDMNNENGYNDCVVRFHKIRHGELDFGDDPENSHTSAAAGIIMI